MQDNSKQTGRDRYEESRKSDLSMYAGQIGSDFAYRINRLAHIIGKSHDLSVGEYKEAILRSALRQYLPKRLAVASGFIAFPTKSELQDQSAEDYDLWNLQSHVVSRQLDIIIYDSERFAPILSESDFVVVSPAAVQAVVEVKGFLNSSNVKECVGDFVDLGRKWSAYCDFLSERGQAIPDMPSFLLMAWDTYVDKEGHTTKGEQLRRGLASHYHEMLSEKELGLENRRDGLPTVEPTIPIIRKALIYQKAVVSVISYSRNANPDSSSYGYYNLNGTHYRYDDKKQPIPCGDRTFIELLQAVYPGEFWHQGLTNSPALKSSEDGDVFGTTDVLTGEDISW